MRGIPIYSPTEEDFSGNGLGLLLPTECTITEKGNQKYELTLVQPIFDDNRWAQIKNGCILKAIAPKRENPLYEYEAVNGDVDYDQAVTRQVYYVNASSAYVYSQARTNRKSKKVKRLKRNAQVVRIKEVNSSWYQVAVLTGGAVGYMQTSKLAYTHDITENITSTAFVQADGLKVAPAREQLFRIYNVEIDSEDMTVKATAMHITYDIRGEIIDGEYNPENETGYAAVSYVNDHVFGGESDFRIIAPAWLSGAVTGEYGYMSRAEALLDPDVGIVAQSNGLLIRDNYDVIVMSDDVRDRGVTIRRRKNLESVTVKTDDADVVTRIIPYGSDSTNKKKKDAEKKDLYLDGTIYIDSPHIDDYPTIRTKRIKYEVDAGGDKFPTIALARAELRRLVQLDFENGVDLPTYGMDVDFIQLANTDEYADYASLQAVHLFDTVTVIDELIGVKAKVRVTGYTWNVLTEQYDDITLGELKELEQTTYGYSLANGSVSGQKIINGSVDGSVLRSMTIEYAKLAVAAINQLAADAIIALTGEFQEISSKKLTTNELYAAFGEMLQLRVGSITADTLVSDTLAAELAKLQVLIAGTATFDRATVQNLLSQSLIVNHELVEGKSTITNLAVLHAQLVDATVSNLVLKASDGKYYKLDVDENGHIAPEQVSISEGEISSGRTSDGKRAIVETSMTVSDMSAQSIDAVEALIGKLRAVSIDVDTLFARDVFTTLLSTRKIVGDKSLTVIVNDTANAQQTATNAASVASSATAAANSAISKADTAKKSADDAQRTANNADADANEAQQTADAAMEIGKAIDHLLSMWFDFTLEGLVTSRPAYVDEEGVVHPESIWSTVVDNVGFHIRRKDLAEYVGSFYRDRLRTQGVEIGSIVVKATNTGGWVWVDA